MPQISLTDDRILDAEVTDDEQTDTNTPDSAPENIDNGPVAEHPAVEGVDIDGMELETDVDGWRSFPHPATITSHIEEDMCTETSVLPDEVSEALDELTDEPSLGEFLVFEAREAYEYLETLQKKSDRHLENFHRADLIRTQLSNGKRNGQKTMLSTYDKKWICTWEVQRRLANRDSEKWAGSLTVLSNENSGLPNNE